MVNHETSQSTGLVDILLNTILWKDVNYLFIYLLNDLHFAIYLFERHVKIEGRLVGIPLAQA